MKKLFTKIKKALHQYVEWLCFEQIYYIDRLQYKGPAPEVDEIVKRNWKARICISSAMKDQANHLLKITKVTEYSNSYGIEFIDLETGEEGSCCYYWLSPVEFWRLPKSLIQN
jgi:hypothetical protein